MQMHYFYELNSTLACFHSNRMDWTRQRLPGRLSFWCLPKFMGRSKTA